MDYTIFYKTSYENGKLDGLKSYDLFLSAYDDCERTTAIFGQIDSTKKIWLLFPHYADLNVDIIDAYTSTSLAEDEYFINLLPTIQINENTNICIDITGFIRPHLIFLIILLHRMGVKKIDCIYSEPTAYIRAENTLFSGFIEEVELIKGCTPSIVLPDTTNDVLIMTAGYDDKLIAKVSQKKSLVQNKYYIVGLPSLQPDFYQESVLKIQSVKDVLGKGTFRYAPAFDPFVTAQLINEIILENKTHSNIYLSPLSTKPQTLGMALYYLWNYMSKPISIIFPFSKKYFAKTAKGIKRTWIYTVELP